MYKLKNIAFVFLCLVILLCSSCIYASDVNETTHNLSQGTFENTVLNNDQGTFENTALNNDQGSFDELNNDIQNLASGDVYNIEKDYCFTNSSRDNPCITISADNITINGNGHCIDGKDKSVTFKIMGDNVKISDLTFSNCHGYGQKLKITIEGNPIATNYVTDMSPVYWKGNNGTISNCIFLENVAVNGGAITWAGDNGNINNLIFINNTARGVGGAIYLAGRNININDTFFINSTSQLFNESVYLDRKHDSFGFNNIGCDNIFYINGTLINADTNNLRKVYYSQFFDENINIIPIIYSSLLTVNFLNEDTYCYGIFSNETQTFTLVLAKNFDEYNITYENEYVIQARSLDDVFAGLISNFYEVNAKLIKTVQVNNLKEYNAACNVDLNKILKTPVMDIVKKDMDNINNFNGINYVLDVILGNNSYFRSNQQWSENNGFNIILINGNGATIHASSGDRDENKWFVNQYNQTFAVSNLTVEGFNIAIENLNGTCIFNNVHFNNNRMDYLTDRDDGAAILNAGTVICTNCTFTNNYAKNGGAIFSQGLLILENCTFKNNKGYGTGNDVLNVDEGVVVLNGKRLSGAEGPVEFVESISATQTALITAVCAVGVVAASILFTCVGFIASGGNIVIAITVGICVGVAVAGILGVSGAYSISSHQYNLNYNRKATFIAFTTAMAALAVQSALITADFLSSSTSSAKIPKNEFEKNDEGRLRVKIDDEYYKVGEEAFVADDGKWHEMEDLVDFEGKYYLKEHVVEVEGKPQLMRDCEFVDDKDGNGRFCLRSDCVKFEGQWYYKGDCIKLGDNYYPQWRVVKISDSYFLKMPNGQSQLIWGEVQPILPEGGAQPILPEGGAKPILPENPSIEIKYFNELPPDRQNGIVNNLRDYLKFDEDYNVVGWNYLGESGKINEVIYNPGGNSHYVFIKYTDPNGNPMQVTVVMNNNYKVLIYKAYPIT